MPILRVVVSPSYSGSIGLIRSICESAIQRIKWRKKTTPRRYIRLIKNQSDLYMGMDVVFDIVPMSTSSHEEQNIISVLRGLIWDELIRKMPYLSFGFLHAPAQ